MDILMNNLFQIPIPILEKIIRPIIVYLFLIIGLRLAGKRELAQLNPFDLVVLLTISNTVQNAIIGSDNSVSGGIIGATTLLAVNYIVVRFIHRNRKLEQMAEGNEIKLISDGRLMLDAMDSEGIDQMEIEIAAHKEGLQSLEEVQTAILEPGGTISFIRKEVSPADLRQQELLDRISVLEAKLDLLTAKL